MSSTRTTPIRRTTSRPPGGVPLAEFALVLRLVLMIGLALVEVGLLARDRLLMDARRVLERAAISDSL